MAQSLVAAAHALRAALCRFDPDLLSGADCATLVSELAATEKTCAGARARAAARAAACGAHKVAGFDAADAWLAQVAGSSTAAARNDLEIAAALESCPATAEALAEGRLSMAQAGEITRTEVANPGAEADLLRSAAHSTLSALRERARARRLAPMPAEELHRAQHEAKCFSHWRTALGNIGFSGELPPEAGVPFLNRIDAEAARRHRAAKRDGTAQAFGAHAADALAALVAGGSSASSLKAELVLVCDLNAFRRGHAHAGEPCHLLGGGPVPVALARELSADAFLKAVLHDGTDISTVAHLGRHRPAHLQTALGLGAPPDFAGVTCVEAGCERRYGLEWDHVDPLANQGPTSYENLKARCWPHHQEKTGRDRAAGLLGAKRDKKAPPDNHVPP